MKIKQFIKCFLSSINPKLTSNLVYYRNFHKFPNYKNMKSINEKLQYLKFNTYYRNNTITTCVDKYRVKKYLDQMGKDGLCARTLFGGYDDVESMKNDWDKFPQKFVLKCNHGSGYNIIVKNKDKVNVDEVCKKVKRWMKEDFWKLYGEPQYRFVKKQIFIEENLGDDINTFKFYCFNGIPKILYVSENGEDGVYDKYYDYYDMEWNWQDIRLKGHLNSPSGHEKPDNFEEMKNIAAVLAKPFPFVRIDLYSINGNIYFSEYTFVPTGGYMKFDPPTTADVWGEWLDLE